MPPIDVPWTRTRVEARPHRAVALRRRPSPRSCTARAADWTRRSRARRTTAGESFSRKRVVDEAEVVTAEQTAAELEDDRRVLGAGQLVVEPDAVIDVGVRHAILPVRLACGRGRSLAQSQLLPTRSQATSLGSHSVLMRDISRDHVLRATRRARRARLRRRREVLLEARVARFAPILVDRHVSLSVPASCVEIELLESLAERQGVSPDDADLEAVPRLPRDAPAGARAPRGADPAGARPVP